MGETSTSRFRGRGFFMQVVRPHLTAGLTLVSAVILGLGLVAIPPDVNGTRTEVRSVQFAAFGPYSATPFGAALKKYFNTQANTGVSVTPVVIGAPDITTGRVATLLEFVRTAQSTGSPKHATGAAAQSGINPVIRLQQSGNSVVSAIPDVSELASSAFNPLWPLAVLFYVVVIPVFAVLLFFFPPVFPATASAVSAIPEPLDLPAVPDKDVLKVAAAPANSGQEVVESGQVGLDEAVVDSGQVGLDEAVVESGQVGSDEAVDESGQVGSNEAVDESDRVESKKAKDSDRVARNEGADDSDRVALNRKGSDTSHAAASNQQTAGTGQATSQPAGPANSTADGDPSDASS